MADPRLIPEVNIGLVGHVDHGKSTLVEAITGKWPAIHSEELKRGITIKLGYADATIYKCKKCGKQLSTDKCLGCAEEAEPVRTISFVDAPGHETLMATVLAGASLMDGALLIIAANEPCPQPQTREHLMALDIAGIKRIIIVQNKIDLVSAEQAMEHYRQIKEFTKGSVAESSPVIPVSAQQKINIDEVIRAIQETIPTPERGKARPPKMLIVRSFDINRPGIGPEKMSGGIIGGSLIEGSLRLGDEIEIRPGIQQKEKWKPLLTKVAGLQKAGKNLEEAGAGGLLGLMTELDPSLTKADSLAGSVAGLPGKLPDTLHRLRVETRLFEFLMGKEEQKIAPIKAGEMLMINVGTARTVGTVTGFKKGICELDLKLPVCAAAGDRTALSRRIGDRWRLIGWGLLK